MYFENVNDFTKTFKVIEITIATLAVISNLFVIILFVYDERLRTRTFCYVFALSIADLLLGLVAIPFELVVIKNLHERQLIN